MSPITPLSEAGTPATVATMPDRDQPQEASAPPGVMPDDALVIVPVRNMVMFPGMIVPISIGRESSIKAAQYAIKAERPLGILMQRNPEADAPMADDLMAMGTVAVILRYVTSPDGSHHIICQGQQRFRVLGYLDGFDFIVARVERLVEADAGPGDEDKREIEARYFQLKERAVEVLQLLPNVPRGDAAGGAGCRQPRHAGGSGGWLRGHQARRKTGAARRSRPARRLDRVIDMLVHRIEVLNLSRDIDQRTKASIGEREREFLLREQLKDHPEKAGRRRGRQHRRAG